MQETQEMRVRFPGLIDPLEEGMQPTPVFLPVAQWDVSSQDAGGGLVHTCACCHGTRPSEGCRAQFTVKSPGGWLHE